MDVRLYSVPQDGNLGFRALRALVPQDGNLGFRALRALVSQGPRALRAFRFGRARRFPRFPSARTAS